MTRQILLLSHPRSGSSWLGSVLALGRNASYRREPVLTRRMGVVDDPFAAAPLDSALSDVIDTAFRCEPGETVVVKEVTPLLVAPLTAGRDVVVVHLRRHPGDVAASHLERGWRPSDRLVRRRGIATDANEMLRERWSDLSDFAKLVGYFGAVDASVADQMADVDAIEARYEDLNRGELALLTPLFTSLGLGSEALSDASVDRDRSDAYGVGGRRLRTSSAWRDTEDIAAARAAWTSTGVEGYDELTEWTSELA